MNQEYKQLYQLDCYSVNTYINLASKLDLKFVTKMKKKIKWKSDRKTEFQAHWWRMVVCLGNKNIETNEQQNKK